ncbi:Fc.00g046490.m01.CDS01 [Cosmosporella sp. VM-42]
MGSTTHSWANEPIAIVGLSCKFAGDASSPEELWKLMVEGRSAWSEFPASRFNYEGAYHPNNEKLSTMNVRGGHFLDEDVGLFDAAFFNFSAEVASSLDPQFRLQLESVYEALENAGLPLPDVAGSNTSVFAGTFVHDYRDSLIRDEDNLPRFFLAGIGAAMASNRISHFFDFKGASMTLDTGCSTTLVALHQAVQNLRNRESDMSIVAGSNVILNPDNFKAMGSLGFLSPDGKCFAFDSRGNGYGRGEGVATIVIKRLKDAIAAGDPIRAVIRETALNQDGKTETITSPSQAAQEALMRECYSKAGIDTLGTQYFEAHGTGTSTGDPIEAGAVAAVFQSQRRPVEDALRIGSIKTNIGHTEATSGLASIAKVVLAMERGFIPPTINFEKPNPKLTLVESNLKVATELEKWPASPNGILRASINNFGYGGSNAHVIMEDAKSSLRALNTIVSNGSNGIVKNGSDGINGLSRDATQSYDTRLLLLSAKDEAACGRMVSNLRDFLATQEQNGLDDVETFAQRLVYTLGQRRTLFPWVAAYPVPLTQGIGEIITALDSPKFRAARTSRRPRIGMVFTGQGAQWYAMGRELITAYPLFKESIREADTYLRELGADWSLMGELHRDAKTSNVNGTGFSIPICTALQISLVRLLRSWGVTPAAVTSHSSGEIGAAYTVGAINYRTAMGIAYYRSKLAADMTLQGPIKGGMIAVGLGRKDSEAYIERLTCGAKVVVACVNSPSSTTVAGDIAAILELEALLKADGVFGRRLRVDTAYHSHHMKPIADDYRAALQKLPVDEAKNGDNLDSIAFGSPVTGYRMTSAERIADPEHWVRSLLQPVQFINAFTEMVLGDLDTDSASVDLIVEIGPHTALGGPIQQILELPEFDGLKLPYYGCLVRHTNAMESMQALAANLLKEGYPLDMEAINFPQGRSQQVQVLSNLPSYPWNHQTRHWVEPRFNKGLRERTQAPHELLGSLVPGTNPEAPSWRHILRAGESPWVRDHSIQSNMLYPGCGFVSLAIEAAKQQVALLEEQGDGATVEDISGYQIRDVNVLQALVVPDTPDGIEIQTVLHPVSDKAIGVRGWKQFEIFSVTADNQWSRHAQGLISVETGGPNEVKGVGLQRTRKPLDPTAGYAKRIDPADMWNVLGAMGIQYGPTFRDIKSIVQSGREMESVSTIVVPDTSVPKDLPRNHVVHPATFDAFAQGTFTALPGTESRQESPRVFQSIEKLWVSSKISHEAGHSFQCHTFLNHADAQGIESEISVVDGESDEAEPVLEIKGLVLSSLGRSAVEDETQRWKKELCSKIEWACASNLSFGTQPAVDAATTKTNLSQELDQIHESSLPESDRAAVLNAAALLRQIIHENPRARILEIGASIGGATTYMLKSLGRVESGGPLATLYHFTNASSDDFEAAREEFAPWSDVLAFDTLNTEVDPSTQGFELGSYDLVLSYHALQTTKSGPNTLANVHSLIKPGGKLLSVETTQESDGISTTTATLSTVSPNNPPQLPASDGIVLITSNKAGPPPPSGWLESLQRSISKATSGSSTGPLPIVQVLESASANTAASYAGKFCVFLGETQQPLLRNIDAEALEAIKIMATTCKGLLWVTRGGAVECENPDLALAMGFLRSLRNEYLGRPYLTLDLDPKAQLWSDDSVSAIVQVTMAGFGTSESTAPGEFEYAVRDGVFMIPRLFKDTPRNNMVSPDESELSTTMEPLHQPDRPLCMHVGMPGLLDTLSFTDDPSASADTGSSLSPEMIEVEPRAYGVNFRDVMVAMGQLHERVMGLECAGVITRVGSHAAAHGYVVGDNVFCLLRGPFGSRAQIEWTGAMHMPKGLSFEEAASLPVIMCTAYICLIDLAHLQRGQTVLIHAAAGGVGQAAMMVAKHLGAEIFATVGSPDKHELVMKRYGIPADHIFSSRDASFAPGILAATGGRGVDVVLNSLAGPLLQESFNVLAPFGHFVEIGKRDLEINSHLEMRPFTRQVTFSAFYLLSLMQHKPRDVHRVLAEIARLLEDKVIAPVHPVTAYAMGDVAKAFRLLQTGKHMGKVVLSAGPKELVPTLRRTPTPRFSPDASYLLVGGVGGIGRSIAHWMVSQGAKNLILLSRSAGRSEKTAAFVSELREDGCRVKPVSCDVADEADLGKALSLCKEDGFPPVRGVIQAAMVLQDTILEQMTIDNFKAAITPKVHGTWNLHKQFERSDTLDFFVILSSAVGVAGNASQSNYAAAGSYEDALARWRVARGLPAVSIDLGAVKAIGVAAETAGVLGRLGRIGFVPISEEQVLGVLGTAILSPYEPQVVVGLNSGPGKHWDDDGESQLGRDARFAALRAREAGQQGETGPTGDSLASKLAAAGSPGEANELVGTAMAEKLSDIFMIPVADIDMANKPAHYGIDSLVAVELRNMLLQQVAAEVSIFGIMQSASLAALVADAAAKSAHVNFPTA